MREDIRQPFSRGIASRIVLIDTAFWKDSRRAAEKQIRE